MEKSEHNAIIQVLPENLINKIAAGEVIDRPSSVVKELVENAIDAGADAVTVILKDGGRALIQIIDNGKGMSEQDTIMSFQRHATSKIRTFQDIEKVLTLGFRGEALASIASIARVELRTVPKGEIEGTAMFIEGGIVNRMEKTGGNSGTSIAIKNLFYNTPARRKFLRAGSTEYRHILAMMSRFTLAFPQIEFTLVHEDNQVYSYKKATHSDRVREVLGNQISNQLVEIDEQNAVFHVNGFLGNSKLIKKTRSDQYFFVNDRYISDRTLSAAVNSAYSTLIPKGQFPVYVLFFKIDPERLDVNVHPTKSEIKFADQQMLFSLVRGAVLRALKTDAIIPDVDPIGTGSLPRPRFRHNIPEDIRKFNEQQTLIDFDASDHTQQPLAFEENQHTEEKGSAFSFQVETTPQRKQEESKMLWQLHNKYIMSQIKSGLVVIDQHAAHERIIYEKVKKSFASTESHSQQLLFPQTLEMLPSDFEVLMEILPFLEKIGFRIKGFGGRTVVVEGVPAGIKIGREDKILSEIIDEYQMRMSVELDSKERVAKSMACRGAIMSGDKLSEEAMQTLIDQLFACETPYFCPHGRPTMITISIEELDSRFERT